MSKSATAGKSGRVGAWVLLAKLAPKLLKVLAKLGKFLKLGKTGLAAGSFAAYAVLFSWPFALVLMGSLFIHEMGHIWSMKRNGLKTKGVYFIPFLGAAAVSESVWPNRKAHVEIALMGPVWGFALALATYGAYLATGHVLFAALAGWMAMVNLFNLLPINPLDGGRVITATAYSISSRLGGWMMALMLVAAFALAIELKFGLFYALIPIGALELFFERDRMRAHREVRKIIDALSKRLGCAATAEAVKAGIVRRMNLVPSYKDMLKKRSEGVDLTGLDRDLAQMAARDFAPELERLAAEHEKAGRFMLARNIRDPQQDYRWLLASAIQAAANDCCSSYPGFFRRSVRHPVIWRHELDVDADAPEKSDLFRTLSGKGVPPMTPRQTAIGFGCYLALAVGLAGLMYAVAHVPAADAALKVFVD